MSQASAKESFILDSGALIALERAKPIMTELLIRVRADQARVVVPDAVVAQIWRGGSGRQALVAALLGLPPERCVKIPLDTSEAKRVGVAIDESGHADVVDVHVAITADRLGAAVVTSDRDDIVAVRPSLAEAVVDV